MNITLARHAQTLANREGIVLGRSDSSITASGQMASAKLAPMIPQTATGMICSSPLGRAVATAQVFAAALGWPVTIMDTLTELSCGAWEGMPRASVMPEGRALRSSWTDSPPGGESCAGAQARVKEAILGLHSLAHENILVVGHAGINQVFLKMLLGLEPEQALKIRHPHDVLYRIEGSVVTWLDSSGSSGKGFFRRP